MGPPIFIGGNTRSGFRRTLGRGASMGPPIFIGGNRLGCINTVPPAPRFNGAADFHRRKYHAPLPLPGLTVASMGPPIFIGGNVEQAIAELDALLGFNGAADFHRRKFAWGRSQYTPNLLASMGPPIFIGGNAAM